MGVVLRAEPDWAGAAQALVSALEGQADADVRVELIDRCRAELGEQVYPAFLKLLAAVGRFAEPAARALVAEALARALVTARLPATRIPAWGAADRFAGLGAGRLQSFQRSAGPLEFLCLWLTRDLANEPLSDAGFERALELVLRLFDASPDAARLYRAKLRADLEDATEGLHTQESRAVVRDLEAAWAAGREPAEIGPLLTAAARAARSRDRWGLPHR